MRILRVLLYIVFALSGAAGLLYELTWSRYLALFVGHSAYAQVLVIAVFLGGMAGGALLVGRRSGRVTHPLVWYASAEVVLGLLGFSFHYVFGFVTDFAYDVLLPSVAGTDLAAATRWIIAVLLILPQSVLLGMTFPLMSAGVMRAAPNRAGGKLSLLYFANSLGGAAGVLVGGFMLVERLGLPGTIAFAGITSFAVAIVTAVVAIVYRKRSVDALELGERAESEASWRPPSEVRSGVWQLLLTVSFFTAVASFIYEIGWIRLLSLVMGSATHSFELMLSAFILGLAIGSLLIRRRADRSDAPLRLLGQIQWLMGFTALVTIPLFAAAFAVMAYLVNVLPQVEQGYTLFGLSRYGIALAVMLPSTICAGMTLPLITATLLHTGVGERSIGWVYGVNTLGAVLGVVVAGIVLLPLLGLQKMLVAGAVLDMGVGVLILTRAYHLGNVRRRLPLGAGLAMLAAAAIALIVVRLDHAVLTAGVFRNGVVPRDGMHEMLYYRDGRTATVGVHRVVENDLIVLTTNGKADASLTTRWIEAATTQLEPQPIQWQDESTQVLAALVALAHVPDARDAAAIGHGSGMSGHYLLAAPDLAALTTVEIEPEMINGSRSFYPANQRVFNDGRSVFVIDDAKAYFSSQGRRYDLIISEPSNPWVSGTASLFTEEFYERIGWHLSEHGVFAQWIQLYEITDDAVVGVLTALHGSFRSYRGFLVGDTDLLIVASNQTDLPRPNWGVFEYADVIADLRHVNPFVPDHLEVLQLFERSTLAPLLDDWEAVNSDYYPHLDLAAEKSRFTGSSAYGLVGLTTNRFDLTGALDGRRVGFAPYHPVAVWSMAPMRERGLSSWLRGMLADPEEETAPPHDDFERSHARANQFIESLEADEPPADWRQWVSLFESVESDIHCETSGVADSVFYGKVYQALDRFEAPGEARAAVAFLHGIATWDFEKARPHADKLIELAGRGERWLHGSTLFDGGVVAYLAAGDWKAAERVVALHSLRAPDDFRSRLLAKYTEKRIRPRAAATGSATTAPAD